LPNGADNAQALTAVALSPCITLHCFDFAQQTIKFDTAMTENPFLFGGVKKWGMQCLQHICK